MIKNQPFPGGPLLLWGAIKKKKTEKNKNKKQNS